MAGALAFTKNRANTALIDDWARLSTAEDGHFVDDSPSVAPQKQLFIEHRHDQSVLSLVVQAHGTITCGSALDYDHPRQQVEQRPSLLKMPFLAMRNSRAESDIDDLRQAGIKWSVIDTAMMPSRG